MDGRTGGTEPDRGWYPSGFAGLVRFRNCDMSFPVLPRISFSSVVSQNVLGRGFPSCEKGRVLFHAGVYGRGGLVGRCSCSSYPVGASQRSCAIGYALL